MELPQISVVLITCERVRTLKTALGSVLNQLDVDVEVIVVSNGSPPEMLRYLEEVKDPRVRVLVFPELLGPSGARNAGLQEVSFPYVAFLDDDDVWAPTKLAKQVAALSGTARWSVCGAVDFSLVNGELQLVSDRTLYSPSFIAELLANNMIPGGGSGVLAETAEVLRIGGFDPTLKVGEDWHCWAKLALETRPAVVCESLIAYRVFDPQGQVTTDVKKMDAGGRTRVASELSLFRRVYGSPSADRAILWHYLLDALRSGRRVAAVRSAGKLLVHDPRAIALFPTIIVNPRLAVRLLAKRQTHAISTETSACVSWLRPALNNELAL